jgi:hypothetical protein
MTLTRTCLRCIGLGVCLLAFLATFPGCGDESTELPTAEEAAKTPPLPSPTTAPSAGTFSSPPKAEP